MTDRDCDTLLDIGKVDNRFIYQFKNVRITTAEPPEDIFKRCGYDRSSMKDKIMGLINRF
jgi:hypothetical protein